MKMIKKPTGKTVLRLVAVFMLFFTATCCLAAVDTICKETTGMGGKLVLHVEKTGKFN